MPDTYPVHHPTQTATVNFHAADIKTAKSSHMSLSLQNLRDIFPETVSLELIESLDSHLKGQRPEHIMPDGRIQGAILSLVLNALPKGKAALVWVKWWAGYVREEIPLIVTVPDLAATIGLDERTVRTALEQIEELIQDSSAISNAEIDALRNYIQDGGVELASKLLSPQLVSKSPGRQPQAYCLRPRYARESVQEAAKSIVFTRLNALMPQIPTDQMAVSADIDLETWLTWKETIKRLTRSNPEVRQAAYHYATLFRGNSSDWEGLFSLQNQKDWFINVQSCQSLREIRIQLYLSYLNRFSQQNRRRICMYLLGCTSSEVDRILDEGDIKSIPQYEWAKLSVDGCLEETIHQAQKEHKGKAINIEMHSSKRSTVTLSAFDPAYSERLKQFKHDTESVIVQIRTASVHRPMTPEEIEHKKRIRAAKAAQRPENTLTESAEIESNDRAASPARCVLPLMRDDNPRFVRQQLEMSIQLYTPYWIDRCGGVVNNRAVAYLSATASNRQLLKFFLKHQFDSE